MITRTLVCKLTEADVLERGKQLANAEHDYGVVDDERKALASDFKDQLEAIDARIKRLSGAIRQKEEARDVECVWDDNFTQLTKELRRCDTGVVVETRPMTDAERQGTLI